MCYAVLPDLGKHSSRKKELCCDARLSLRRARSLQQNITQVEIKGKDKALQKEIAMLEEKEAEQVRLEAVLKRA